ncbi:MAG: TonB-dependent receptor, partial [Planctomycetes bacterium]|nr:TonB-dependent receptor [Planctomycetota bacterium]
VVPGMDMEVSTVSRTESTVGRSPAAVFVVTAEMIRRSGARCVPDALRLVPGVNVARVTADRWAISIRGFNSVFANKLLVQIDGRSVYNPIFSGVYWDQQDLLLEDVERIEVIRGPGATVWGANAVNGVINIITKQARDTQGVFVQGGGGSEERDFAAFRYGGKVGDSLYYRFYGKWDERDAGWATPDAADDWRVGRGGFRMDWQPCECSDFTLQGDFYEGRSGNRYNASIEPTPPPFSPPPYRLTGERSDYTPAGQNILGRFSRRLSDDSDWSIQAYWDHTERADNPSNYDPLFQSCDTFDLDFQHRFPLGRCHSLIWGFGYRNTRGLIDGHFTMSFDPPVRSFDILSCFVQDQITLSPDSLYLTVGSKFSHNDFSGFEFQPTARLLWTVSERRAAWASVSRAVRTPSMVDQNVRINGSLGEFVPMFVQILGNRAVESEQLIAYEIGYRAQPTDAFWWDLAVFYNDYEDLVTAMPGMPFVDPLTGITYLPTAYANAMRGDTYGFELAGTYQVNPCWKLGTGYSFLVMDLQGVGSESVEGESPRNQVYLQSGWDLGRSWELNTTWRYVDSLSSLNVPAYLVMDVRLAWLPSENLEVAVVGRNLLDEEHPESTTRAFYPSEVQRGVYGMVTLRY